MLGVHVKADTAVAGHTIKWREFEICRIIVLMTKRTHRIHILATGWSHKILVTLDVHGCATNGRCNRGGVRPGDDQKTIKPETNNEWGSLKTTTSRRGAGEGDHHHLLAALKGNLLQVLLALLPEDRSVRRGYFQGLLKMAGRRNYEGREAG